MDTTLTPKTEPKPSNEIREKILAVVDKLHGAFWGEFYDALIPAHTVEDVRLALRSLVTDGVLRMKEDSAEHDWEYRRNRRDGVRSIEARAESASPPQSQTLRPDRAFVR